MPNCPEVFVPPLPKTLQDLFATRRSLSCAWFSVGSATLFEIGAAARPDLAVIDRQHGLWDRAGMEAAIGLVRYQLPVIVRVADNSAHAIAEALDAGAASVLVPLVESVDEARRAVSHGRYPPFGARSGGGVRPLLAGPAAMKADGERISIGVMIETVAGVEQVEAIAAVEGLGYLFVGTGDLSLSRGGATGAVERDCARILAAAHARGLPCGIFTGDAAAAREQLANGFDFAVAANDIDVVRGGFEREVAALRA